MLCDDSLLVNLYIIGEVYLRLLGTEGFYVKVENENLLLRARVVVKTLKTENSTSSFGRLRQKLHQKACRTCSTIIFPHSTNHIIDLWRCCCLLALSNIYRNEETGSLTKCTSTLNRTFTLDILFPMLCLSETASLNLAAVCGSNI